MIQLIWSLLGVLAGVAIAVQAPINAQLARGLGMPVAAAAVSFSAGAVVLAAVTFVLARMQGITLDFRAPAPWLFFAGGCLGAIYVTCTVILVSRIGAASLMALAIAGQLIAGMLMDRFAVFGLAGRELTAGRIAGAALLVLGAALVSFA